MSADVVIKVDGVRTPPEVAADLEAVTVLEDLDALSMFTVELHNWDQRRLRVTWSDDELFAVGAEVEIALGPLGDVRPVMVGEITGLEPTFAADRPATVVVRGYDHRHRLARGRRTRTFASMTDSAIVRQVAMEAGLRADVANTGVTLDHVIQSNQSDLDFLGRRARLLGYELYARDKVLFFHPPKHTAVGSSRVDLQACKLEYSIVSPK